MGSGVAKPPFMGLSVCPRYVYSDRIRYSSIVFTDCRMLININNIGIFRVYPQHTPFDYTEYTKDPDLPSLYTRVFPPHAIAVVDPNGRQYIQIDGKNYTHGQGIDLIASTPFVDLYKNLHYIRVYEHQEIKLRH
jgi:hypothetical protein